MGRTIAKSPLVKTALFGEDANWGRIVCAAGYAGVDFNAEDISLTIDSPTSAYSPLLLLEHGQPTDIDEEVSTHIVQQRDVELEIDLGVKGCEDNEAAVIWTCDFSHDYVDINGSYRT